MPLLGQGVLAIWHAMTPEGDQDMIRWHNTEHVAERVGVPGFLRGRRYVHLQAPRSYFDLYETRDADTIRSAPYIERLNHPTPWTQRILPHFRGTFRIGCRVTASSGRGQGSALITVRMRPAPGREAALRAWLGGEALALAREPASHVGAHLLETVPEATAVKTAEGKLKGGEVGKADEPWPLVWLVELSDPAVAAALAEGPLAPARLVAHGAAGDAVVDALALQLTMDA
jgi:hypothetical protein